MSSISKIIFSTLDYLTLLFRRIFTDHFSGPGIAVGPVCVSVYG